MILDPSDIWVAAGRRLDGVGRATGSWPQPYVRVSFASRLEQKAFDVSPATARDLAKGLKAFADASDPPKPRKAKS